MTDTQNFFTTPSTPVGVGGYNGGFGGGDGALLAILAATGMLGGRRGGEDACVAAQLNTAADGINHNINTSMIGLTNQLNAGFGGQRDLDVMQKLGSIEGDIWKAEGQAQLAIAQAVSEVNSRVSDALITTVQGQAMINKNISDAIATSLASQSAIKETVAAYGVANLTATKDSQYAVTTAVRDDGDKTRALISRQYEDTLNRELSEARNALVEQRAVNRGRESEINITNTNTATAQQFQIQGQQQQQAVLLNVLVDRINGLQNAVATNSNLIVGNTGAVLTGPQTANPVNVRT